MASHDDDNLGDEAGIPRPVAPQRWKLKREVSTGDLLLAGTIVVGLFLWGGKIESRLSVVESRQEMQRLIDAAQDSLIRESMQRIEADLRSIKDYLLNAKRAP